MLYAVQIFLISAKARQTVSQAGLYETFQHRSTLIGMPAWQHTGGSSMDSRLTPLEVIGLAIRSEEDAAEFYMYISRRIDNELVRTKYQQLAKEEAMHRKMLVEQYKRLSGKMVHVGP